MPMNLLLAEDDAISRAFLGEALRAAGHRVVDVADGESAWRVCQDHRFDALLLDLNLPGLRGDALLTRLRGQRDGRNAATRAIALTADDSAQRRAALLAAGFERVGHKPLSVDALLALLGDGDPVAMADEADDQPDWDDAGALAAAGGNQAIVTALRELLRKELPMQRQHILAALDADAHDDARAVLHRLRASCGFCGAARLAAASRRLDGALGTGNVDALPGARADFLAALDRIL
ncbi:MAG: response regulator [Lysobacteraceae bacterium]